MTVSLLLKQVLNSTIGDAVFSDYLPIPFIASAERTGAAIFQWEIDFARNHFSKEIRQSTQKEVLHELLFNLYPSYPVPIEDNADFIRQLEDIGKRKSFLAKEHPEVLDDFADIIGGEYNITQDDQLYYVPKGTGIKLTMVESSSAVRSLLDLGFYLRHVAQKGDLLMVDEPELNLHPGKSALHC